MGPVLAGVPRVQRRRLALTAGTLSRATLAPVARHAPAVPVATAASVARITPDAPAYPPGKPLPDGELPGLRTAFSRTYAEGQVLRARIHTAPVNYVDANGTWQKIDPRLVARAGGGWRNAAGDASFELPASLATPVRIARGADSLSFALTGATGRPKVSGSSVTYAGALPGTDVRYDVLPHALKESIVLRGRTAPTTFAFDVTSSAGLTLRSSAHGIDAIGSDGAAAFTVLPPSAVDADGAVAPVSATTYALRHVAAGRSALTLTVDPAWLAAPDRAFPVTVDPTASVAAGTNTYIEGGTQANANFSGRTYLMAGWDTTHSAAFRSLLDFSVRSAMPVDSIVLEAELGLYSQAVSSGTAPSVNVYAAGKAWTADATWNNYATSSAWTTAGGDVVGASYWATTVSSTGYKYFYITPLVQKWLDGTIPQDGVVVRAAAESTGNANVTFGSNLAATGQGPFLDVTYQARTGLQQHQSYEEFTLTDRLKMSVNVGNGNMELESVDANLTGVGNDLRLAHSYNSMAGPYGLSGGLATNWGFSPGRDVSLGLFTGSVAYYGPSGTADVFLSQGGGAYTTPPGANADLTKLGDNTFELKHQKSERTDKFDTTGRLTSMKDRNGNTITISYSSGSPNQMTSIVDTRGRSTTFTYTAGKITTVTDPLNRTYQFSYDANYTYLLTYTDANAGVYSCSYDNAGLMDEIQTPEGNRTLITYTSGRVNHVQRVTATSPQTVDDWDFDWFTDYTIVTDPNSNDTRYDFEPTQGKVDTVTDALGNDRALTYNLNSDVATAVDAIGAGNTTTTSYNPNNTVASTTIPTGASAAYTYTDASHPFSATTSTDAQSNSSLMTYDGPGNLSSVKDTTGGANTTMASYTYNPASPTAATCGGKYGQRCTMVDGRSKTTTFAYDTNGNVTSVTPPSPLSATTFGSYDNASRVGTVTDGKGQVTRYTYDNLDRVTEIKFGGSTTCTPSIGDCVQYTFDDDGNQLTMVDSTGTTTFTYDKLNRQLTKSFPGGGTAASVTYDGVGNVLTYVDAGGTVTYAYNAANHLVSLAEPSGSCTSTPKVLCTEFQYNENGKRKKTTYPGATVMDVTYDNSGRPTRVKTVNGLNTLTDFQYSYTKNSADTGLTQTMTNTAGAVTTYTYDTLSRLSKAVLGGGSPASWLYCYDLSGNRTSYSTVALATCPGATTTYTYNDANQLTAKNGSSVGWTYDNNGNETAAVGSITRSSGTYNTKDQYTSVTVGGTARASAYAGRGNTERVSASGISFQNSMLGLSVRTSGGVSSYYTRDPDGTLISVRTAAGSSYYSFDGLGSVVALVSSAGLVVNSYTYDPYGDIRSSTETVSNNFKFTGAYYDSDKHLYKLGMRYYDATLGRFTQQDPTGQEPNMYVYAGNNPVNFVDPSGGDFGSFLAGVGLAVGVASSFLPGPFGLIGGAIGTVLNTAGVYLSTGSTDAAMYALAVNSAATLAGLAGPVARGAVYGLAITTLGMPGTAY